MAINNSTISAEISGSTIVVDIRVHLFTGNVNRRFKDGAYGYLKRSVTNLCFKSWWIGNVDDNLMLT